MAEQGSNGRIETLINRADELMQSSDTAHHKGDNDRARDLIVEARKCLAEAQELAEDGLAEFERFIDDIHGIRQNVAEWLQHVKRCPGGDAHESDDEDDA